MPSPILNFARAPHRVLRAVALLSLGGCATTSFSPPSVNLENETYVVGSNYSFGQRCMPNQRLVENSKGGANIPVPITPNAKGAQRLIDNFIYMYRCRAHSAANGRQAFEVPAILTGVATTTAAALGAGTDVAIIGGATTALLGAGKSYYSPQLKADIYDSALDAVLCIKARAASVDPLTIEKISKLEKAKAGAPLAGVAVAISTEEQFYHLITTALLSVERVLAQRLSTVGTFDPAGVIAEIKALVKEIEKEAAEAAQTAPTQAAAVASSDAAQPAAVQAAVLAVVPAVDKVAQIQKIKETLIEFATLQPELEQCVIRAKI